MTKGTEHMLFMAESTRELLGGGVDDLVLVGEFEIRGRVAKMRIWSLGDGGADAPASRLGAADGAEGERAAATATAIHTPA